MAVAKKKVTKKSSKWSFNINRKWALPIAFVGVFVIGGGIYLAKSNAATTKYLSNYTAFNVVNFTTTDGVKTTNPNHPQGTPQFKVGDVFGYCFTSKIQTPYGVARLCDQYRTIKYNPSVSYEPTTQYRTVINNMNANTYTPNNNWTTFVGVAGGGGNISYCKTTGIIFVQLDQAIPTSFGPVSWGQEYRTSVNSPTGWQVRWATYSPLTKACSESTGWMNIAGSTISR